MRRRRRKGGTPAIGPAGTTTANATASPRVTPAAAEVKATEKESGQEVRLARGGKLLVTLESNRTTGFAWKLADGATPVLAAGYEQRYDAPQTGLIGAGGTEVFTFTAASPGTATLRLTYERSFDPPGTPPARTYTLKVRVD